MANLESLRKYNAYQKAIGEKSRTSMKAGCEQIRELVDMADDLRDMVEALCRDGEERLDEIDRLERDKGDLSRQLEGLTAQLAEYREQDALYSDLKLKTAKLSGLISDNEDKALALEEAKEALQSEREEFEAEKARLLSEKRKAEEDAEEYQKKWTEAERVRDDAVKKRKELEDAKKKQEDQLLGEYNDLLKKYNDEQADLSDERKAHADTKERLQKCEELCEWYKKYAAATDRKIIDYFGHDKKVPLRLHFYSYLNKPAMWSQHREHFPEFQAPDKGEESPRRAAFANEKSPAAQDAQSADTENVETQSADTESVETQSADAESVEMESADVESVETESADVESAQEDSSAAISNPPTATRDSVSASRDSLSNEENHDSSYIPVSKSPRTSRSAKKTKNSQDLPPVPETESDDANR
ncbi:MAG: hypothetical protein IJQ81_18570 [Oscillibacter sp.]|nr:hypothetical protein [Oscillibacter sp.]